MIRKENAFRGLAQSEVLINDTKWDSQFFKVSDVPSELHSGKNYFKIKGNSFLLQKNTVIEVEVTPEDNPEKPYYHEVSKYIDSAGRRLVTIYVYPEDTPGACTITITGTARRRPNGKMVSPNWLGRNNVKWSRDIYCDPTKENSSQIIFNEQPRITITENVKSFLSESHFEGPGGDVTRDQTNYREATLTFNEVWSSGGAVGSRPDQNQGYVMYHIISDVPLFSASMQHGTIRIPSPTGSQVPAFTDTIVNLPTFNSSGNINTTDYTASIMTVINSTKIRVDVPYTFEYETTQVINAPGNPERGPSTPQTVPVTKTNQPSVWSSVSWSLDYIGDPQTYTANSFNLTSYANIILANIDPIAGDVHKVKTWMRSHGINTWDLLSEEIIEARELFSDDSNVFKKKRKGDIVNQDIITSYWAISKVSDLSFTPELKADTEALMNGMIISGSKGLNSSTDRDNDYIKVTTKDPITVYRGCSYNIAFKAAAYGEIDDGGEIGNPWMQIFTSGSAIDGVTGHLLPDSKRLDTNQLKFPAPPSPANYFPLAGNSMWANPRANSYTATPTPVGQNTDLADFMDGAQPLIEEDYQVFSFVADNDGTFYPVWLVKYGKWVISDVQVKPDNESGFTPNHTIIEARVPEYQQDDILDFKFEFYNPQDVRADLVFVTESINFEGGNTYINNEGYLGEGIIFDGVLRD